MGGQVQRNTPGGGIRKLEDAISQSIGYNTGRLNADWVEILMGFDIGWTDINCDNPVPFPGWPAPPDMGKWMTPTIPNGGRTIPTDADFKGNSVYTKSGRKIQVDLKHQVKHGLTATDQYDYEPPRVITDQKNRAKRLKCIGNAVKPQQILPILLAISEIESSKAV